MMTVNEISQEEADHYNFHVIYYPTLRVLSYDVQRTCEEMGNYNTPWEIQDELVSYSYLANSVALGLGPEERQGILALAEELKKLPTEAIATKGLQMTSAKGCQVAMGHPSWEPLRRNATLLLVSLESAIARSERFLYPA